MTCPPGQIQQSNKKFPSPIMLTGKENCICTKCHKSLSQEFQTCKKCNIIRYVISVKTKILIWAGFKGVTTKYHPPQNPQKSKTKTTNKNPKAKQNKRCSLLNRYSPRQSKYSAEWVRRARFHPSLNSFLMVSSIKPRYQSHKEMKIFLLEMQHPLLPG